MIPAHDNQPSGRDIGAQIDAALGTGQPLFRCGSCLAAHEWDELQLARANARIRQLEQALVEHRVPVPEADAFAGFPRAA